MIPEIKEILFKELNETTSEIEPLSGGDINLVYRCKLESQTVVIKINDKECYFQIENKYPGYQLTHRGKVFTALVSRQRTAELNRLMPEKIPLDLSKYLLSPMPGLLLKLCVLEGQTIKAGEELAVVEAMKMENSLRASKDVKIKSILTTEGANLTVDQKILEFED